jgi:hypothetical protein
VSQSEKKYSYNKLLELKDKIKAPSFTQENFTEEELGLIFGALNVLEKGNVTLQFKQEALKYFDINFLKFYNASRIARYIKTSLENFSISISNVKLIKILLNVTTEELLRVETTEMFKLEDIEEDIETHFNIFKEIRFNLEKYELFKFTISEIDKIVEWFPYEDCSALMPLAMMIPILSKDQATAKLLLSSIKFDHYHNVSDEMFKVKFIETISDFIDSTPKIKDFWYQLIAERGFSILPLALCSTGLRLSKEIELIIDQKPNIDEAIAEIEQLTQNYVYPDIEHEKTHFNIENFKKLAIKYFLPHDIYAEVIIKEVPKFSNDSALEEIFKANNENNGSFLDLGKIHSGKNSFVSLLNKSDPAGLFLGQMTESCMHYKGMAEKNAVIPGYTSPYSGFLVVFNSNTSEKGSRIKYSKVKAAAYCWMAEKEGKPVGIVVDSYEYINSGEKDFLPFITGVSKYLADRGLKLFVGEGGKTPVIIYTGKKVSEFQIKRPSPMDKSLALNTDSEYVYDISLINEEKKLTFKSKTGSTPDYEIDNSIVTSLESYLSFFNSAIIIKLANVSDYLNAVSETAYKPPALYKFTKILLECEINSEDLKLSVMEKFFSRFGKPARIIKLAFEILSHYPAMSENDFRDFSFDDITNDYMLNFSFPTLNSELKQYIPNNLELVKQVINVVKALLNAIDDKGSISWDISLLPSLVTKILEEQQIDLTSIDLISRILSVELARFTSEATQAFKEKLVSIDSGLEQNLADYVEVPSILEHTTPLAGVDGKE